MVTGSSPAAAVRAAVLPVVEAAGLVLEDVEVTRAGRRSVVRVVVDLADGIGGIDSDTLGAVSRDISTALDAADPVAGAYTLEVSTPGTDRPLTELRHFRRARTRLVRLVRRDGTRVRGRLVEADERGLVLRVDGAEIWVAFDDVVRGVVEVELDRPSGTTEAPDEGEEG
jgi:ribosome maturation factor RimP